MKLNFAFSDERGFEEIFYKFMSLGTVLFNKSSKYNILKAKSIIQYPENIVVLLANIRVRVKPDRNYCRP